MQARFKVIDASGWRVTAEEPAGADPKYWLEWPNTGTRWLWKPVTVKDGHVHGEDWAEKAASELGQMLGVCCAQVEMAVRDGESGALSRDLRPPEYEMHNGAVALSGLLDDYQPGATNPKGRPGHSLDNIERALQGVGPPPGAPCPETFSAFDCFAGVLVLDAWIANRDRHDENWSILYPLNPLVPPRLCGAYDQAGCLGFNLTDSRREEIAADGGLSRWCEKGTAWRFEYTSKPASLVSVASDALAKASGSARAHWLSALRRVSDGQVRAMLEQLPVLSDPGRTFAGEVLRTNRERLLDECY